ncbi:hypothetical protein Tco_0385404 [Tanacetum coccineum]
MSRMEDDLFTYEVEIAEVTNISYDLKKENDSEQQISHEFDDDMEYDPSDVEYTEWLDVMMKLNSLTKNPLILKMKMKSLKFLGLRLMYCDFETPLCRAFKEFNYLLQIDQDVVTKDIDGFTTYEDYKDDWIYE